MCDQCLEKRTATSTKKGTPQHKGRRGRCNVKDKGEVGNDKNCCGDHILTMLTEMNERSYLVKNQTRKDVAETCWDCGDEF